MASATTQKHRLAVGLGFLTPNILGFFIFVFFPLIFSFVLAFSNWDLRLHNMFKNEPIQFVEIDNFIRIFMDRDFWRYLGNTLFFMMAIPFSIIGSLIAAILLNQNMDGKSPRNFNLLLIGAVLVASISFLTICGLTGVSLTTVLTGIAGLILIGGVLGGTTIYRTLFYAPHFAAGVATFILWKKLYNPYVGPINQFLEPVLDRLTLIVRALPQGSGTAGTVLLALLSWGLLLIGLRYLRQLWLEKEINTLGVFVVLFFVLLPVAVTYSWLEYRPVAIALIAGTVGLLIANGYTVLKQWRERDQFHHGNALGSALVVSIGIMTLQFCLLGLAQVSYYLPSMAEDVLNPPVWIADYYWAKPSLMIMGLWAAIGSNNMILYLAGLKNVPVELYEAADIDGAGRFQKFWHITWPQLTPVTFFIVIISVIGGLQGGFEMARTMTKGGPAGSTTTLSYIIYNEGFESGGLGYASAIAWILFLLIFLVTIFNWKFASRYVND